MSSRAEKSFLKSQMRDNKPRPGNKSKSRVIIEAIQANTAEFFSKRVLTDEMELAFWQTFMTGVAPDGTPVKLDAICWNAFRQAVAYKRGMPTVRVDSEKTENVQFTFNIIGGGDPHPMRRPESQRVKISQGIHKYLESKKEDSTIPDAEVVDSEEVKSEV